MEKKYQDKINTLQSELAMDRETLTSHAVKQRQSLEEELEILRADENHLRSRVEFLQKVRYKLLKYLCRYVIKVLNLIWFVALHSLWNFMTLDQWPFCIQQHRYSNGGLSLACFLCLEIFSWESLCKKLRNEIIRVVICMVVNFFHSWSFGLR